MRLALLSNVTLDLLDPTLKKSFELHKPDGYGQWVQESFMPSAGLVEFAPEAMAIVLDGSALVEGAADPVAELDAALGHVGRLASAFPAAAVYASTIDVRPVAVLPGDAVRPEGRLAEHWAQGLEALTAEYGNLHVFDLRGVIEDNGRKAVYSDKMWYLGSAPYSIKGGDIVATALTARILASGTKRKKVLVVDLDNTLWGGVLGEDGADGIELGRSLVGAAYRDAQLRMKDIAATGILLAIASKNDEDLVRGVLANHPQMVLRADDFVAVMANWDDKASNIAGLAETLNLGLDSFVFLDDNPVEQEAVRQALPQVSVVNFPRDVSKLPAVVSTLFTEHFFANRLTAEDAAKLDQYKQEAARASTKASAGSMEEYLASLGIEITLTPVRDDQMERTAQLTGKTNQFNLLTARFTPEELAAYRSSPDHHVYVANVTDKFGDSGLVLVLMVHKDGTVATIDNLLMSCRVMGRHIEDTVLAAVEERLAAEGVTTVKGRYEPTARNTPVVDLLDRLDYRRTAESDGAVNYEREVNAPAELRRALHPVVWGDA